MLEFFWIIFSYLLGSLPFGYLIARLSGKDVLKIGWRKTSGSNVFKNVGKWQGVLAGLLDVFKGYLAVYVAQYLSFSPEIQVFSGLAAVFGNNWSCFLKFAGGRGIGTFVGAFLALSPQIILLSIIPLVVLAIFWNASIGTLLFLATAIFLSFYFNQFTTAGLFTVLSLIPIFIKRLSPIGEIKETKNGTALIRNRLILDCDEPELFNFRIKRIIRRLKGKSDKENKIAKIVKPVALPFLLPPKIGWKAAKFGFKIAKKPIEKIMNRKQERVVLEIKPNDFKKMMLAASKKIVQHQEEINKINVFPVADKDTGYNLAATLLGVEGTISPKEYSNFQELTNDIKEAAMINARGNAGMIYTGYLIEVLDHLKNLETINSLRLAIAMKRGIKVARLSIADPVEGTILDVIKTAGNKAYEIVKIQKEKNIIKVLEECYKVSQIALKETKEKLKVLKDNNVVDAGALGFVKILEAWTENLKGVTLLAEPEVTEPFQQPETKGKLEQRYEVVSTFRKTAGVNKEKLKQELSFLGDSLEIIELENKIKIHIHTNQPDVIIQKIKEFPEAEFRTEDMEAQIKKTAKKEIALVVDDIADLPEDFLKNHNIENVPFTTRFPDGEIVYSKEEIYPKMREAIKTDRPLPSTSAPSFKEFLSAYQRAFNKAKKILVITVCSKLSGTYSSARIARSVFKKPEKLNIFVFDSFTAEVGEGLVAIKSQELIFQGKNIDEILNTLKEFCPKVILLASIDDFKYLVHGGRLRIPEPLVKLIYLIQKIGIRPLIILKNGKIKFSGVRFGRKATKILADEVNRLRNDKKIRTAIAHADNLQEAKELKKELEEKTQAEVAFISSVSPVVGTHTGPGTVIVAFHPIDE